MTMTPAGEYIYSPKVRENAITRREISQFSDEKVGITIYAAGVPTDADANSVTLDFYLNNNFTDPTLPDGQLITTFTETEGTIQHEATGIYTNVIATQYTNVPGIIKANWHYTIGGQPSQFVDYYEIVEPMPTYDSFSDDEKSIVQRVTWLFGDMFDNTSGSGPHLAEEFQTHYGYERISQLMYRAMDKINMTNQPFTSFQIGGNTVHGASFPTAWYGLLLEGTYIETLRHLIRSYVEQPNLVGISVSYADRRDYMQRWQAILQDEMEDYTNMLRQFKRWQLGLGGGTVIVSGGVYGGAGGYGLVSTDVYTTRAMRFYPSAPAVNFSALLGNGGNGIQ